MQNKNFLKLSLYECKLEKNVQLSDFGNFKISISFNSKTLTTDKININHSKFKSGKFFYYEIPNTIDDKENISISAIGTSWMFFNSVICSGEINYKKNLSIFNDKKFWYPLKNKENKEIIQIFISIWTEYSLLDNNNNNEGYAQSSKLADISLFNEKSSFINNSSIGNVTLTEKNEIKPQKLNNTTMIKTQRVENKSNNSNTNISTKGLFMHLYKETNRSSLGQDNANTNINKTTNNIVFKNLTNINNKNSKKNNNLNFRNNNNSSLRNNNFDNSSPFSPKDNLSGLMSGNNLSYINNKNENDLENNKIEYEQIISLIGKYEKDGGDKNIIQKLWEQINLLKEKEKNLEKQQIKYNEALSKLKEKNKMLNKERQQLDFKIYKFKKEQNDYEQKNMNLTQYISNFESNLNEFNLQKRIENNNKEIYYNLNYYISTGCNFPLTNKNNSEFKNINKILSISPDELIDSFNIDKININQ